MKGSDEGKPYPIFNKVLVGWARTDLNQDSENSEETAVQGSPGPRTADAVSLLSESALSKSLRVSSLVLFFFPPGTGSFNFFCFLFRFSIPMSQRGHST